MVEIYIELRVEMYVKYSADGSGDSIMWMNKN